MPYANNRGFRIYYEVEGVGPPLILHHGTFGSGQDWRHFGYVDALKGNRRVILLDARGHGASDKPHDPDRYDLHSRTRDVIVVLDELGFSQADYFGYSMGGWIGFGLAKYSPGRIRSMILGGAHPYAENMQSFRDLIPQESATFIAMMEQVFGSHLTPAVRTDLLANDLRALLALTQDRTSLAEVLPTMTMPCLLFDGELDPRVRRVQECARAIAIGMFFSLPQCTHVATLVRSDLVLPRVQSFLTRYAPSG